jgi:hypothetical protein
VSFSIIFSSSDVDAGKREVWKEGRGGGGVEEEAFCELDLSASER